MAEECVPPAAQPSCTGGAEPGLQPTAQPTTRHLPENRQLTTRRGWESPHITASLAHTPVPKLWHQRGILTATAAGPETRAPLVLGGFHDPEREVESALGTGKAGAVASGANRLNQETTKPWAQRMHPSLWNHRAQGGGAAGDNVSPGKVPRAHPDPKGV